MQELTRRSRAIVLCCAGCLNTCISQYECTHSPHGTLQITYTRYCSLPKACQHGGTWGVLLGRSSRRCPCAPTRAVRAGRDAWCQSSCSKRPRAKGTYDDSSSSSSSSSSSRAIWAHPLHDSPCSERPIIRRHRASALLSQRQVWHRSCGAYAPCCSAGQPASRGAHQ